jgi:flagellar basal-body rod modification protein FlgD
MSSLSIQSTAPLTAALPTRRATTDAGASGAATSNSTDSQTSLSSLGSTFLKLLTQELQNQDPTAPMDSTQMVGQMISLNQLDQLASINQLLTAKLGGADTSTTGTGSVAG